MHCSKEMKPQFVPPPVRSRHQGRQVADWASAGPVSIIGTSAVSESATTRGRIKGMPTLQALPTLAELNTRHRPYSSAMLHWCDHDWISCSLLAMPGFGHIDGMHCGRDLLAVRSTAYDAWTGRAIGLRRLLSAIQNRQLQPGYRRLHRRRPLPQPDIMTETSLAAMGRRARCSLNRSDCTVRWDALAGKSRCAQTISKMEGFGRVMRRPASTLRRLRAWVSHVEGCAGACGDSASRFRRPNAPRPHGQ